MRRSRGGMGRRRSAVCVVVPVQVRLKGVVVGTPVTELERAEADPPLIVRDFFHRDKLAGERLREEERGPVQFDGAVGTHPAQLRRPGVLEERQARRPATIGGDVVRGGARLPERLMRAQRVELVLPARELALLGGEGGGNWHGWAFSVNSASPRGEPLVPIRLLRRECGLTPLGISR